MAYLGIAALVFFLVIIPLLLVAVTVAAIAGKMLTRTLESRRKLEQDGERPASAPATRVIETELPLARLSNKERAVVQSVGRTVSQRDRSSGLSQEAGVYTVYLKPPVNWNDRAEDSPLPWTRPARESEPDWDRDVRRLLSSVEEPLTNGPNKTDVTKRSAANPPRRLARQSRSLADTLAK